MVVVIIGIGSAMAIPRMNLSPRRTEAAVAELSSLLMAAQRAAVSGQHDVVVAFEQTPQRIRVHMDRDNDGVMDAGEPIKRTLLPTLVVFGRTGAPVLPQLGSANVSFTRQQAGVPAVTFNRAGSASEEGGFYLTTAAQTSPRATTARAVVVDRATARPATFRYSSAGWQRRF